jgi:hypothetical protein
MNDDDSLYQGDVRMLVEARRRLQTLDGMYLETRKTTARLLLSGKFAMVEPYSAINSESQSNEQMDINEGTLIGK